MRPLIAIAILLTLLLAACSAAPTAPPLNADAGPRVHDLQVVSNGWHTAIVLPAAEVTATGLLPEAADFPAARSLEFGWGDRKYYPARNPSAAMALGAALTDTPAVLHMAGLAGPAVEARPKDEVIAFRISAAGLQRLVAAIAAEVERAEGGRARAAAPGLYAGSRFYDAHGTFNLNNTCNTWTARMLRIAGIDVSAEGVITAGDLMARLRDLAEQTPPG